MDYRPREIPAEGTYVGAHLRSASKSSHSPRMPQPRIRIWLLGRFSVRVGDEEVPPAAFGGRLVRTLVRILVIRRGEMAPKDVLVDALWGERPPADPVRNLEILVVRARKALGDTTPIETGPGGYTFTRATDCWVDVERLVELAVAGRHQLSAGRPGAALSSFRGAIELWEGEPLPEDSYSEWAQEARRELARRYLDTLEGAAIAALAIGDNTDAVLHAERAVTREPLREASHLLLAQGLAASGDVAAALDTLAAFRRRLSEELGLDPSPDTAVLQARILRGEPLSTPVSVPVAAAGPTAPVEELTFVGRDAELQAVLQIQQEGRSGVVLVTGLSGSGKSRLLAEAAARSSVPVVSARAFLAERQETWSLARSLVREALALDMGAVHAITDHAARALAYVMPEIEELRVIPRPSIDPESRRALALEGAVRIVEASGAGLVLTDDVQWADATSLALLGSIAERTGVGLAIAYRPEEVDAGSILADSLEVLRRRGAVEVPLGSLAREAVVALVADAELARVIAEETDRTPIAIVEVLRALAREGAILRTADGPWIVRADPSTLRASETARAGQRRGIEVRAGRLSVEPRAELSRLALLGREVPARLLARAAGSEQARTLDALDVLLRAGLARLGDAGWATAHDLVAETIAAALPPEVRARRHAELADALREEGADPGEVAYHLAGAGDPLAAARGYADGAFGALLRSANDEAERLADAGMDFEADEETRVALLRARGEARSRRGDLAGGEADLWKVLEHTPKGAAWSQTMARLAWLVAGERDYREGLKLAEAAIAAAGRDRAAQANALAVAGRIDMNLGDLQRCRARAGEALSIFEDIGDAEGIAQVLDLQAIATFEEGELREAVALFERAATLFTSRGALFRAVMPLATRSRALALMGRYREGVVDSDRALALARMLAYPEGECYALLQRAFPLVGLGRVDEAESAAAAAVSIAERLNHREWLSAAKAARATALQAAGDLAAAEAEFRTALELAEGMPIHTTIAASGLAGLLVAAGRAAEAPPFVQRAVAASERNRGAYHVAQLARAEVAATLGDPGARRMAAEALAEAEAAGHLGIVPRLRALAGEQAPTTGGARRSG